MRAHQLYREWIVANCWSEAVGLALTFSAGIFMAPALQSNSNVATVLLASATAVAFGTVLEGVLVGFAQESVLRRYVAIRRFEWTRLTAIGACIAWLLGMVPSTIFALMDRGVDGPFPAEPPVIVTYVGAAILGFVLGPILGYAQIRVLRRMTSRASVWLWANGFAWAAGMTLIFAGMDLVPWSTSAVWIIPSIAIVCGIAGLVVGSVHGKFLVKLLAKGD